MALISDEAALVFMGLRDSQPYATEPASGPPEYSAHDTLTKSPLYPALFEYVTTGAQIPSLLREEVAPADLLPVLSSSRFDSRAGARKFSTTFCLIHRSPHLVLQVLLQRLLRIPQLLSTKVLPVSPDP